jgi:hypothetical protein
MANIGIYAVSSQSGMAYLAEFIQAGHRVYGYARKTPHGVAAVEAINEQQGVWLERPGDGIPTRTLIPMNHSAVGHDPEELVRQSDLLFFSHPSLYHEEAARELAPVLRRMRRRVPIVLSPSRSMAAPYLWQILGEDYPIISFQTCPYACKVFKPGTVFIKRRKQAWVACIEGDVRPRSLQKLRSCYRSIVFSHEPAATTLGNIGAVFHPTPYLMNLPAIRQAEAEGRVYSFYMEGIAHNPVVGPMVEEVDQIRLRIAKAIGCTVYGLKEDPREEEWAQLMIRMERSQHRTQQNGTPSDEDAARSLRPIRDAVLSAQHWLHYTYGVKRIPGESLASAIARTPNYQQNSCPQRRYADEDVATGLVPLEALAQRLGIACEPISRVIDIYKQEMGVDARQTGRHLRDFEQEELISYLRGKVPCHRVAS